MAISIKWLDKYVAYKIMSIYNKISSFKVQINCKEPVSWSAAAGCAVVAVQSWQMTEEFAEELTADKSFHGCQQNPLADAHDH